MSETGRTIHVQSRASSRANTASPLDLSDHPPTPTPKDKDKRKDKDNDKNADIIEEIPLTAAGSPGRSPISGRRSPVKTSPRQKGMLMCPFTEFGCEFEGNKKGVKTHMVHRESFDPHLHSLLGGCVELREDMELFQTYFERKDRLLEDLVWRMGQLNLKYSTNLIWRIDFYTSLFKDARAGKKTTIFSPPFYSGRYGYKLAASMALYGDGPTKGQFNSIFLSILSGEHDSLCQWPFLCPVTFTLIDQRKDNQRQNISEKVKPCSTKKNRPFIGRPIGERNPSFGVQKFVSLDLMKEGSYVKDDTIFIQVDIHTEDLPNLFRTT